MLEYAAKIKEQVQGAAAMADDGQDGQESLAGDPQIVDAAGNPRQSIPVVPVIGEYARTPLTIRAFEDYGDDEGICPVDAGTVQIFDGFADAPELEKRKKK